MVTEPSRGPPGGPPPRGLLLIGRKEYLDFPDWGLRRLRVKVDTGAYNSALDVAGYDLFEVDGVGRVARLRLALDRRRPDRLTLVEVPVLRTVVVSNPGGLRQQRPLLEVTVRLGPVTRRIRLTITDRSHMRCRMILGRQALAGSFLVDVSQKYLLRREEGVGRRG
jgi:hypothetical protein